MKTKTLSERFWPKVKKTNRCWKWTGAGTPTHGRIFTHFEDGRSVATYAHRVSWVLHFGPIPAGMQVLHSCDNGFCVRPDHLFLGTQIDNIADMDSKGRRVTLRGQDHPLATLTENDVRKIRKIGRSQKPSVTASQFGTSAVAVHLILRGVTWRHLLEA